MRHRWLIGLMALALVLAACGGGEETAATVDTTTTAASAEGSAEPTTTVAPTTAAVVEDEPEAASGANSDYCLRAREEDSLEPIDIFGSDLESEIQRYREALEMMVDNAPAEIRDDVALVAEAGLALADLLEKYDYNLLAIPPEEATKLEALATAELEAASRRIAAYCGVDFDETAGDIGSGVSGSDSLPEDFPVGLIPPGAQGGGQDLGPAGFMFLVDGSFDEIVSYYQELLGGTLVVQEDATIVQGAFEGAQTLVTILPEDPVVVTVTQLGF